MAQNQLTQWDTLGLFFSRIHFSVFTPVYIMFGSMVIAGADKIKLCSVCAFVVVVVVVCPYLYGAAGAGAVR